MADVARLSLTLGYADGAFALRLRFWTAGSGTSKDDGPFPVALDFAALRALAYDPLDYGRALTGQLFPPGATATLSFVSALRRTRGQPLQLQIHLTPLGPETSPEKTDAWAAASVLHWETLCDPETQDLLAIQENIWLARYASSSDARSIAPLVRPALRAVALAANPSNLAAWRLDPVDTVGELSRAKEALAGVPLTELGAGRATLDNLLEIVQGGAQLVYLAAHGGFRSSASAPREPWLFLEDTMGQALIPAENARDLVHRLRQLATPPHLVVLAACASAGADTAEALLALGPQLAAAGIPAVVAMQGQMSMVTAAKLLPAFFRELVRDGQVDRALAVARNVAQGERDWWRPALFLRLEAGRLWDEPAPTLLEKVVQQAKARVTALRVTPALVAPLAVAQPAVVLGQRVTLAHLREGRFMERPAQLESIRQELKQWVAQRDAAPDPLLHFFWVDGRSGSGKSVLLLQLLQRLVVLEAAEVVWVDNDSAGVETVLAAWDAHAPLEAKPPWIFVDDFYAPQSRAAVDFVALGRLLRSSERRRWPVVVTCGPPEHTQDFANDLDNESCRVRHWRLPPVGVAEREGLRDWFVTHTQTRPKVRGTAFEQTEGLMLSLMLEMREGEAEAFGKRFAARLKAIGLEAVLVQPLALNRLYLWTPASWLEALTPEQRDKFDQLNADDDFSWTLTVRTGEVVNLTHPHLSDLIYTALRPSTSSAVQRATDVVRAFDRALHSDWYLALQLLRVVAQGHERLAGLEANTLARGMVQEWQAYAGQQEIDRYTLARVWTDLAQYAKREVAASDALAPTDPLALACQYLGTNHPFWSTLWQRLWANYSGHPQLAQMAWSWLNARTTNSAAWSHIWQRLLEAPAALPSGSTLSHLAALGVAWLAGQENRAEWSFVWQGLLALPAAQLPAEITHSQLAVLGVVWLVGREDRAEWNFVWQALLALPAEHLPPTTRQPQLAALGVAWLAGREDRADWRYVWRGLLALPAEHLPAATQRPQLAALGVAWLTGREDRAEWSFVWERLLTLPIEQLPAEVTHPQLAMLGVGWLAGREDWAEWSFVWLAIFNSSVSLPQHILSQLIHAGLQWLINHYEHISWYHVWQRIYRHRSQLVPGEISSLFEQGYQWLQQQVDHPDWLQVWQKLFEAPVVMLPPEITSAKLATLGITWLAGRENHPSWPATWRKLIKIPKATLPSTASQESLVALGVAWLAGQEERAEWAYVWSDLLYLPATALPPETNTAQLAALGIAWLAGREEKPVWNFVWQRLRDIPVDFLPVGFTPTSLTSIGLAWLAKREEHPEWDFLWQRLVEFPSELLPSGTTTESLALLGVAWMVGRENRASCVYIWRKLLEVCCKVPSIFPAVLAASKYQSARQSFDRKWFFIYESLKAASEGDQKFIEFGLSWCEEHPRRPETPIIGTEILKRTSGQPSENLVHWAKGWLSRNRHHPYWKYLWEALWLVKPHAEILAIAVAWFKVQPLKNQNSMSQIVKILCATSDTNTINTLHAWAATHPSLPAAEIIRRVVKGA